MPKNKQIFMIYLFLAIATLIVFWRVNYFDFFVFDDPLYISENDHVNNGISPEGIRWAFTTGYGANWFPLTWISHMLDVQFFGLNPGGHHLTNLLFHIANTLLLFFVLHRMTKARWESAFVAALFALHPLHVQSVAWVAERKDVLASFFWMLTMGAYCSYVEQPRLQRYLLVVLFFAMGLMAKPMLVTLPFVLLLLDYWPLRRFQQMQSDQKIRTAIITDTQKGKSKKKKKMMKHNAVNEVKAEPSADSPYRWSLIRPLIWEKVPFLALTVLSSIVTYTVQDTGGAVNPLPLSIRIPNAFISYIAYIGKMIWPNNLAYHYPFQPSFPAWQVFGAVSLMTAITITVIWKAKRIPYLATGWFWYAGTLVPVIGLVQVGTQMRADRYTYIPLIGLFIIMAWGISELSKNWRYRTEVLFTSSAAVLLCLCIVTWTQVGYWRNDFTMLDHTLAVTDNNYTIYNARGSVYQGLGNYSQAIKDFDKAIEVKPDDAEAYLHRGMTYRLLDNRSQASEDLKTAARLGNESAQDLLKSEGIGW